jgi:WD40 repeat protein
MIGVDVVHQPMDNADWPTVEAFDMAISARHGELFVSATSLNELLVYNSVALQPVTTLRVGAEAGTFAIACSPDGQWLAVADGMERIFLVDVQTRAVRAILPGGERTFSLAFTADSSRLVSACSYQGGATVRCHRIDLREPTLEREFARANVNSPPSLFVDTLASVTTDASGKWLALFETSAIYQETHPHGWCGNLVLYNMSAASLQWSVSIDVGAASALGDERVKKVSDGLQDRGSVLWFGCGCVWHACRSDTCVQLRGCNAPSYD